MAEINLENFVPAECKTCAKAKHAYAAAYMVREQQRRIEELEERLAKEELLRREAYERGSRALRASIDELARVGRRRV